MNFMYLILWMMLVGAFGDQHQYGNMTHDQLTIKSRYKRMENIKPLTLKVRIQRKSETIHLMPTNQLLANEHLPVWLSLKGHFEKLNNIMKKDVGGFTMYHDYLTRSAVIYFHKRRELHGIIKAEYKIEGISIDKLDKEYKLGSQSILNIRDYFRRSPKSNDNPTTCPKSKLKIYPELLVAISHDMFEAIEKDSKFPRGVKSISHILTVYNIADMLYKFVKSADISINIAGIVIEGMKNEWNLVSRLSHVDGNKVNNKINQYFRRTGNSIRQDSYDYVAYHTRLTISDSQLSSILRIIGIAGISCCKHFGPIHGGLLLYQHNIAVQDFESYQHYPTIAHELAHIFGADHDRRYNSFITHPCDRSIMAAGDCPNLCLKWNDKTEEEMNKFFSSPAQCILRNKPQSLLPEFPRLIFTKLQQCKYYGFDTYSSHGDDITNGNCLEFIKCEKKNVNPLFVYPMDGTPCGKDLSKVCWNKVCVSLGGN